MILPLSNTSKKRKRVHSELLTHYDSLACASCLYINDLSTLMLSAMLQSQFLFGTHLGCPDARHTGLD